LYTQTRLSRLPRFEHEPQVAPAASLTDHAT
jgi:hypothetical protein